MFDNLRGKGLACLARARTLLATGDEASVRYACLELRLCIEYLVYDQLVPRLAEVSDDVLKKWTPKQIIDSLREGDPDVDKSVSVAVALEDQSGAPSGPAESLGQDRRFTGQWANSAHNALGNFLHAPTLDQIERGKMPDCATMLRKAGEVADELETVLASPIWRVNFGVFVELDCPCGARIKYRATDVTGRTVVCRRTSCGAIYDVVDQDDEKVVFVMRRTPYVCARCQTRNSIPAHQVKPGAVVACDSCSARFKMVLGLAVDETPPAGR